MKIYCSHLVKDIRKSSNYNYCKLCLNGWYNSDPIPLVIIGYTETSEVDTKHRERFKTRDLSKKKFKRCVICHDLVEKRKHIICEFKRFLDSITVGPAPEKSIKA